MSIDKLDGLEARTSSRRCSSSPITLHFFFSLPPVRSPLLVFSQELVFFLLSLESSSSALACLPACPLAARVQPPLSDRDRRSCSACEYVSKSLAKSESDASPIACLVAVLVAVDSFLSLFFFLPLFLFVWSTRCCTRDGDGDGDDDDDLFARLLLRSHERPGAMALPPARRRARKRRGRREKSLSCKVSPSAVVDVPGLKVREEEG